MVENQVGEIGRKNRFSLARRLGRVALALILPGVVACTAVTAASSTDRPVQQVELGQIKGCNFLGQRVSTQGYLRPLPLEVRSMAEDSFRIRYSQFLAQDPTQQVWPYLLSEQSGYADTQAPVLAVYIGRDPLPQIHQLADILNGRLAIQGNLDQLGVLNGDLVCDLRISSAAKS